MADVAASVLARSKNKAFLSEPFAAAVEGSDYVKCWSVSENKWN